MTVRFVTNDPKAIPVNLELGERFSCSKCDASFGRIHALYDHFDAKHKGIVYPCPKCMKHYTRSSVVSKHIQANHATTCHICHVESVDKIANQRHIETSHRVFKCKKCCRIFGTKSHLTFHENKRCQESINVVTDVKNETFKTTVQKPILESQTSAKQLKECKICGFKGKTDRQRAKHRKTHKRIRCDICEFGTFYSSKFDRHKQKHHQTCQKCPFISKSRKDFDQHFHLETCEICNLVIRETNWKIHYEKCIRNFNSSNKFDKPTVYHCNYCDFKTKKKAFLNMHLRNIHKTDKDFDDPSEKLNMNVMYNHEEDSDAILHQETIDREEEEDSNAVLLQETIDGEEEGSNAILHQETMDGEDFDKSVSSDSTKIPKTGVEEHLVENEILTILDTLKNSKDMNEVKLTSRNLEIIPIPVRKRINDGQDLNLSIQEKCETEKTNNAINNPHVDNQDDNQFKEKVCPHCEFSTDDEELYQHHQVTDHLICYICGFSSEYPVFLFSHIKAIHNVLDFEAGEEEIPDKVNKRQMKKDQEQEQELNIMQEKCQSVILKEFCDDQNGNKSKETSCTSCGFSTDDEELFQHHQVTDHLLCYLCGFTSEYQLFIFRHMKAIHKVLDFDEGEEENKNQAKTKAKPTECPLCSDKFESKSALDRHHSKEHKDQNFICGRCGKRFQLFKYLTHHYHKFHDKDIDSKTIYDESLVI